MQEQETISSTAIATLPPSERAAIALGASNAEKHLRELAANASVITNVIDVAGREEAHRAGMMLRKAKTSIKKTGKDARDDANAFSSAVIAEEKRLISIIEPHEDRVLGLRDAFDAKLAFEKAERERKEAERVAAIKLRIAAMRAIPAGMAGEPSEEIRAELDAFAEFSLDESFMEFKDEASQAVKDAVAALGGLLDKAVAAEAEAARVEADRAELARLQAEMVEQKRQAAEAEAERQRVAADLKRQMEEQQAALAAERAALQAERDAMAAEKLAAAVLKQAEANQAEFDKALVQCAITGTSAVLVTDGKAECVDMMAPAAAPSVDQTVVGLPQPVWVGVDMAEPGADRSVVVEVPAAPPTLRLGQIAERLGFNLSADFLRTLGFEPSGRSGAAMLYHEYQFPMLCAALIVHIDAAAMAIAEPVA